MRLSRKQREEDRERLKLKVKNDKLKFNTMKVIEERVRPGECGYLLQFIFEHSDWSAEAIVSGIKKMLRKQNNTKKI